MNNLNDTWNELQDRKAAVRAEIGNGSNDNTKLRRLTDWIRRELDLESKYNGILAEAQRLIEEQNTQSSERIVEHSETEVDLDTEWTFADLTKQARTTIARRSYLKRQEQLGNYWERAKGKTIYRRKADGALFGVTFSIDKEKKGQEWFLGLPEKSFQEAVLLCQCGPRSVKVIHLPKEFLEKYGRHLSVGKNSSEEDSTGQVKFNVSREGNKWRIDIPQPVGPKDITDFVQSDELLCSNDNEFV